MTTELVISTLNVSFNTDTTGTNTGIILEVDDRTDGYNAGETSFKPGDSVYYWLFQGSLITEIIEHFSTAGAVSLEATDSKEVTEIITFTNSNTASLQYPPSSSVDLEFLGRSFQIVKNEVSAITPTMLLDGQDLTTSALDGSSPKIAGLLRATYTTTGEIWLLNVEKQAAIDFKEVMVVAMGTYEKV